MTTSSWRGRLRVAYKPFSSLIPLFDEYEVAGCAPSEIVGAEIWFDGLGYCVEAVIALSRALSFDWLCLVIGLDCVRLGYNHTGLVLLSGA